MMKLRVNIGVCKQNSDTKLDAEFSNQKLFRTFIDLEKVYDRMAMVQKWLIIFADTGGGSNTDI